MTIRPTLCALLALAQMLFTTAVARAAGLPSPATHRAVIEALPLAPAAMSADGTYIAGTVGQQAYRWDAVNGFVSLGQLPGGAPLSAASGISADGSTVVGWANYLPGEAGLRGDHAFRWTAQTGMVDLGFVSENVFGRRYSRAYAVSPDGNTVVGLSSSADYAGEGFIWKASTGIQGIGVGSAMPHSSHSTEINAISGDGNTFVGFNTTSGGRSAFKWTAPGTYTFPSGVAQNLLLLEATAVSHDGSVIVGQADPLLSSGMHAFVWSADMGAVDLGDLPGSLDRSIATGVSGDGTIVIGNSYSNSPTTGDTEAIIWDSQRGMMDLRVWLMQDFGLDLSDWYLENAVAISPDGLTLVGTGHFYFGSGSGHWRLRFLAIPEPSTAMLCAFVLFYCGTRTQTLVS